jgi:simple sugar transport system ATP-binding protein
LIEERNRGKAILLVSLELDEVMGISDRILVIYEGKIVADVVPKHTTARQLGLYMAGSKQSGAENDKTDKTDETDDKEAV